MSAAGGAGPGVTDAEVKIRDRSNKLHALLSDCPAAWQTLGPVHRETILWALETARAAAPGPDRGEAELQAEVERERLAWQAEHDRCGELGGKLLRANMALVEANERAAAAEARAERATDVLIACRPYVKNAARGISWSAAHDLLMRIDAQLGGPAREKESDPALIQPTDCRAASNSAKPAAATSDPVCQVWETDRVAAEQRNAPGSKPGRLASEDARAKATRLPEQPSQGFCHQSRPDVGPIAHAAQSKTDAPATHAENASVADPAAAGRAAVRRADETGPDMPYETLGAFLFRIGGRAVRALTHKEQP